MATKQRIVISIWILLLFMVSSVVSGCGDAQKSENKIASAQINAGGYRPHRDREEFYRSIERAYAVAGLEMPDMDYYSEPAYAAEDYLNEEPASSEEISDYAEEGGTERHPEFDHSRESTYNNPAMIPNPDAYQETYQEEEPTYEPVQEGISGEEYEEGTSYTAVAPEEEQNPNNSSNGSQTEYGFDRYYNPQLQQTDAKWILNINTNKIHYPSCSEVKRMNEENAIESNQSLEELQEQGFEPCKKCFK